MAKIVRTIVQIDEEKCDGCGICVPGCHEGAIQIVDGKAKLISDNLCDGLGDCLGECPLDAITIIEREADRFDEEAVAQRLQQLGRTGAPTEPAFQGCPGSRVVSIPQDREPRPQQSALAQWPIQLHLVPVKAPYFQHADLLVCADCVPFAYGDFHDKLLRDHAVAIACPKLDDSGTYAQKLAEIIIANDIRSLTVAHMEVPCCSGLANLVRQALEISGRDVEVKDVIVTIDGTATQTL